MRVYKVVPAPGRVFVNKGEDPAKQIASMANLLVQESAGGWVFVSSAPISVSRKAGKGFDEEPYNALIFAREV